MNLKEIKNTGNYIIMLMVCIGSETPLLISIDYLYRFNYTLTTKIIIIPCIMLAIVTVQRFIYLNKDKFKIF